MEGAARGITASVGFLPFRWKLPAPSRVRKSVASQTNKFHYESLERLTELKQAR